MLKKLKWNMMKVTLLSFIFNSQLWNCQNFYSLVFFFNLKITETLVTNCFFVFHYFWFLFFQFVCCLLINVKRICGNFSDIQWNFFLNFRNFLKNSAETPAMECSKKIWKCKKISEIFEKIWKCKKNDVQNFLSW